MGASSWLIFGCNVDCKYVDMSLPCRFHLHAVLPSLGWFGLWDLCPSFYVEHDAVNLHILMGMLHPLALHCWPKLPASVLENRKRVHNYFWFISLDITQHIEMIIVMHAPDSDASCGLVIDMLSSEEFPWTSSIWALFVIKWQPFLICDPFCIVVTAMGVEIWCCSIGKDVCYEMDL